MIYNGGIPQPGDRPSQSQTQLLANFADLKTYVDRNHVAIIDPGSDPDEGKHKFVQMPVQGAVPSNIATDGVLYSKAVSGNSEMFYSPDATTDEYQLTSTNTAGFSLFATNTAYSGTLNGGWTFLPGGLLLQYGSSVTVAGGTKAVTFPRAFTTTYSVTATRSTPVGSPNRSYTKVQSTTMNGFTFVSLSEGGNGQTGIGFFWMAIGLA